jgi:divalent metal cation (Fe/Co/Zn/Cd) transporter
VNGDDPRRRAATLATATSGSLIVVKIALALFTGSVAVLAEATHAAAELLRTIVAGLAAREETGDRRTPVDAGMLEAALVVLAGVVAGFAAIRSFGDAVAHPGYACAGLFACALVSRVVGDRVAAVAAATGSRALATDAASLRSSQITSAAAGTALALVLLLDISAPDAIAAIGIAAVVVRGGVDLLATTRPGRARLTGDELARIASVLATGPDEVIGYGRVGARTTIAARRIDVDVTVRRDVEPRRLDVIGAELQSALGARLPGVRIVVHLRKPPDPSRSGGAGRSRGRS